MIIKKTLYALTLIVAVMTAPITSAQTEGIVEAIRDLVGGYGTNRYLNETPFSLFCNPKACPDMIYDTAITLVFNALVPPDQTATTAPTDEEEQQKIKETTGGTGYSDQAIYTLLTATPKNVSGLLYTATEGTNIPMPLSQEARVNIGYGAPPSEKGDNGPSTQPLNLDSLVIPLQYNEQQATTAKSFIQFVTGLVSPMAVIDFSKLSEDDLKSQLRTGPVQQYLAGVRVMVAGYAVGISNLYQIYADRTPTDLSKLKITLPEGVKDALPENLKEKASQLALEQFMATRRFSAKWQGFIDGTDPESKATPAELQRQTIYLLRDIHYELYKTRLQNERLLATMSAVQIQSTAGGQLMLGNIQRTLCQQKEFRDACPATPTPSVKAQQ